MPRLFVPSCWLLAGLLLVLTASSACAQRRFDRELDSTSGGQLLAEQAAYNVTFYDLALAVDPVARAIDGTLTVRADIVHPVGQVVLDLDTALTVQAVEWLEGAGVDGQPLRFVHEEGRIWADVPHTLQPGERMAVRVRYGGVPRVAPNPPWIGGWTWAETSAGEPWIATSNQGEGADLWWPVKDHPSDEPDSMGLHITVPEGLVVATNGRLRQTEPHGDGTQTYHWFVSTPINNYGVALNIAPYRTISADYTSTSGLTFPVTFWVLPERYEDGRRQFDQFLDHLRFYEETLGPYPFRADKYGIAHTPHLGMEHQTIIAYGDDFDDAPRGFDWLHHHELGHEWWGNLVTAPDWNDFWIHEGFCTYMQALYAERLAGADGYLAELVRYRPTIRNEKPLAPRASRTTRDMYFSNVDRGTTDNDIYYKGSWVLHTLRGLIGDDAFMTALRRMAYPRPELETVTDGRQTRFATSDDFIRIAEAASGRELDWFFNVYLRQPDLPRLVSERTDDGLRLRWDVPDGLPFPMPVPVAVDGTVQQVAMTEGEGFAAAPTDADVVIDPDRWLLKVE